MSGESLERADLDRRGLVGDRRWAVRDQDGKLGSGKSTRRFRKMEGLLHVQTRYADGTASAPQLTFPDGAELAANDPTATEKVSSLVGRPVELVEEAEVSHLDDGPVHLVTTSGLAALTATLGTPVDPRRMRPNLVLDTGTRAETIEDGWLGCHLQVGGEVVLRVVEPMPRCVMVDMAQCGIAAHGGVLRAVTELNDGNFGVLAEVVQPGTVRLGDLAVERAT